MDFGNKFKFFKWWYVKDVTNYGKLLKEKTVSLIGITADGEELIQKIVPLSIEEDGLAVADCGPKGRFYLTPNQMVSREGSLRSFWLVDQLWHWDTDDIRGTYTTIEAASTAVMLPAGMRLFGKPMQGSPATVHSFHVNAIIPIGNEQYIAWEKDRNSCTLIGDRETNETEIKILMETMGQ